MTYSQVIICLFSYNVLLRKNSVMGEKMPKRTIAIFYITSIVLGIVGPFLVLFIRLSMLLHLNRLQIPFVLLSLMPQLGFLFCLIAFIFG